VPDCGVLDLRSETCLRHGAEIRCWLNFLASLIPRLLKIGEAVDHAEADKASRQISKLSDAAAWR